eukprot:Nk52_evm1s2245 gene=Nk52_evmTU1s2245
MSFSWNQYYCHSLSQSIRVAIFAVLLVGVTLQITAVAGASIKGAEEVSFVSAGLEECPLTKCRKDCAGKGGEFEYNEYVSALRERVICYHRPGWTMHVRGCRDWCSKCGEEIAEHFFIPGPPAGLKVSSLLKGGVRGVCRCDIYSPSYGLQQMPN